MEVASRFIAAAASTRGKYVYGLTEDSQLCCFCLDDNRFVGALKV
jgi:hypothetical protein